MLQHIPDGFRTLSGRVKERWEQLVENEVEKMENHRRALLDVLQVRSQETSDVVAQEMFRSQPGLR
ncbi:MAG TPA: hypothetical protein VFO95_01225 [Gemmatimonadales bacterium]|nr:hypothetical protein [Gemmatimonadales bacterium]